MPESQEHKALKKLVRQRFREWFGAALKEYPSEGHNADVYSVTIDSMPLMVEIVWTPTRANFFRDLSLVSSSDALVKIIIVNPKILHNDEMVKEFERIILSERQKRHAVSEMIDGRRLLEDEDYLDGGFRQLVNELIELSRSHIKTLEIKPEEMAEKIFEKMTQLYDKEVFDPSKADIQQRIYRFTQIAEKLNSEDPNYFHRVELTETGAKYMIFPKSKEALEKEPLHGSFKIRLVQKDGKIRTFEQMLEEAKASGGEVVLQGDDILEMSIYKGDKPLIPMQSGGMIKIIPQFPPPIPVRIFIPGRDTYYDGVMLGAIRQRGQTVTLSNEKQELYPITFEFQMSKHNGDVSVDDFRIIPRFSEMDQTDRCNLYHFIEDLKQAKRIAIKDRLRNRLLLLAWIGELR